MEPDIEYGQISSGCEVLISTKEFDRSVAQLPFNSQRGQTMHVDKDEQGLFGAFKGYFKTEAHQNYSS